jgi:hypothetical protein
LHCRETLGNGIYEQGDTRISQWGVLGEKYFSFSRKKEIYTDKSCGITVFSTLARRANEKPDFLY